MDIVLRELMVDLHVVLGLGEDGGIRNGGGHYLPVVEGESAGEED
jgi:hypothetical protein